MVCQYPRAGPVSSEKQETTAKAGGEERGRATSAVGTAMVVMGSYRTLTRRFEVMSRAANATKALRSRTCGRLYPENTILERLAQDFQDVAFELGQFTQKEPAVVRQRHLPGRGDLPAADQAHVRDGVVRGAERARGDDRRAPAGEAGDAMDARGVEGFGEGHGRHDGGEPPRQPRFPSPRGAQEEVMIIMPT
jgi:hypothetical protein